MKTDTLSQTMQKQQVIYSFLQGIYEKELTREFLVEMPQKMKPLLAVAAMLSSAESKKAVEAFIKFTDSISSQNIDELQTRLAVDYARLFLSIYKVPAHPSESTYREGLVMQHYRDEVLKAYWSFGMTAAKEFTEPEDHIATELSFMSYLSIKAKDALDSGDNKEAKKCLQAQKDFLEMHLAKWVPALARDIFNNAKAPFYKGIAAITTEFIVMNLSSADDFLNQLKG